MLPAVADIIFCTRDTLLCSATFGALGRGNRS